MPPRPPGRRGGSNKPPRARNQGGNPRQGGRRSHERPNGPPRHSKKPPKFAGQDFTPSGPNKREDFASEAGPMRLQKFLAHAGVGSRRACEELILQGRVVVNGEEVRQLGTKVDPAKDRIMIDGERVQSERYVYYAVHKPKGYVSTNDDPAGRPRVVDLLPEIPQRVYTVGRLDEGSVGLILLTNDGELANRLTHPKFGVEKIYRVLVAGKPGPEIVQQLTEGVWLAEGKVRALQARLAGERGEATIIEIVLAEGKNREIRRMLAKMGHKVMSLTRVAVGPIILKGIPMGGWRSLTKSEVDLLRKWSVGERPVWASKRLQAPASAAPQAPRRGAARHQDPTVPRPPKPPAPDLGGPPRRPGKPDPARLNPPRKPAGQGGPGRPDEKPKGKGGGLPDLRPRPPVPPSRRGNHGEPIEITQRKVIGLDLDDVMDGPDERPSRPQRGDRNDNRNDARDRPAGGRDNRRPPHGGNRNADQRYPRQNAGGPPRPPRRGNNNNNNQGGPFDEPRRKVIGMEPDNFAEQDASRPYGNNNRRPGGPGRFNDRRPPQGGNRNDDRRFPRPGPGAGPGGPPPRPPIRENQAERNQQQDDRPPPPPRPRPSVKRPKPKPGRPSFRRPKGPEE